MSPKNLSGLFCFAKKIECIYTISMKVNEEKNHQIKSNQRHLLRPPT